jgi:16S rRNA (cytosine967-C5)-methyltransferase
VSRPSARQIALTALIDWRDELGRADLILSHLLAAVRLEGADRAFTLELFYGTLRNLTLLDFWITCLRPSRLEPDVRDILRLGLYQLLSLGTPEHAAVNESVNLARPRSRGVINAILRTAVRQREELHKRAKTQPLSVRESHPEFLVSRWQKNFGPEATTTLCRWNNQPAPIYGRVNRLKIDPEHLVHRYPEVQACHDWPGFVQFPGLPVEALQRGHCYIQDPSTAIPCELLDPQLGETILDACAAPGGKTTYLAQMMQNQGVIVACDREPARLRILRENVVRLGATIISPVEHDWRKERLPRELENLRFDRILIDAPCTNTGVIRRRVDVRWRLQRDDFLRMQREQLEIVRAVARLLKPGGILVYATCSLEPEENESVVQRMLAEMASMRLLEQKSSRPFRDRCDGTFAAKFSRSCN